MKKNQLKPSIRFKDFTEDWEQCKLIDESDYIIAGGDVDKTIIKNDGVYPVIANALTNDGIVGYYDSYYRIKAPALTVTGRGDVGHAKARKVDFTPVVRLLTVKTIHDVDFLENAINKTGFVIESTGVPQLTVPKLEELCLLFPKNTNEEILIGKLLTCIDNLITLHQRKYDKLSTVKQSLLRKMFPNEHEKQPSIRFKGFTEDWEQRQFKDVFDYERPDKYIVSSDKYDDGNPTPVLTANKGFILGYTNENRTYNNECVIFDDFTLDSKYVDFKFMVKSSAMKILTAKNGYDLYFSYNRLNSSKLESLGHARHYISVVQESDTLVPKYNEQKKISKVFKSIEFLITLHQRELELLKNIKKSLLKEMFPN